MVRILLNIKTVSKCLKGRVSHFRVSSGPSHEFHPFQESPLRKRLKSGNEAAQEQPAKAATGQAATQTAAAVADTVRPPLRPEHVREAWRRLQQSPVGRMRLWETAGAARVDEWHEGRGEALLALGY